MSDLKFKPNGAWVVLPNPVVTKTKAGIYIDEELAKQSATNILAVLAKGPHCQFIEVGDTVMIDPRTEAVRAEIDGEDFLVVGEHQILGKW
jgi:co-chaperonin GroES (HSP10)|tara:strand:+ start:22157 stop:22429 length:273 start_codon:yes stop_codon:yes gene_type:complete